jgi:predicted metal-dependent HD superfamily phosphohydrolase
MKTGAVTDSELVTKARAYVEALLRAKKPEWLKFHTFEHAEAVVKACKEMGVASRLSDEELEIVVLAAWFHDVGYVETAEGHEENSVEIAVSFLRMNGFPEHKIAQVAGYIRATKMPQAPKSPLEQLLCDADIAHLASRDFSRVSELIRYEIEHQIGRKLSEIEWLTRNTNFVAGHKYFTHYAQVKFRDQLEKNVETLKKKLARARSQEGGGKG